MQSFTYRRTIPAQFLLSPVWHTFTKNWDHLVRALSSQFETITDIIHHESGPIRKKKAQLAAQNVLITLKTRGFQFEYLTE